MGRWETHFRHKQHAPEETRWKHQGPGPSSREGKQRWASPQALGGWEAADSTGERPDQADSLVQERSCNFATNALDLSGGLGLLSTYLSVQQDLASLILRHNLLARGLPLLLDGPWVQASLGHLGTRKKISDNDMWIAFPGKVICVLNI